MIPFFVYLLRCGDGSYYCGQTDNMDARMQQHFAGEIGYTATRKPVELVWQGEFETREGAIRFEQQVKGWSRAKKEALIRGDWDEIKNLARSHFSVRGELVEALRQAQGERMASPAPGTLTPPTKLTADPSTSSGRAVGLLRGILEIHRQTQRRAIAKAITLLESTRADHRAQGDE